MLYQTIDQLIEIMLSMLFFTFTFFCFQSTEEKAQSMISVFLGKINLKQLLTTSRS